ncbi:MAG: U32 family peptidase, partial [Candidatus Riflebacteria bacterium]|nr:U32 family peptidase [Candidatus Riflebacteria bacterium]
MQQRPKIELLAPAGSQACLKAACLAGADAVYLAGKRFGARAFAANFDEKGLRWARRVTRALGRKMYVTLNTIVFEHEWKLLDEALSFYESLQPDALIIQDIGVAVELRHRGSKIPLHLSTQAAWFGQGGVEELKELGITRVILPREVGAAELQQLVDSVPFELEIFVHGAMCYSISGRCFWSIALGTRSGNRGTCAQPCRR